MRVKNIKSIVGLPNPRNKESHKLDNKQKKTSNEGQRGKNKKRMVESGSLTPITNYFKKEEQMEHRNSIGKSTSNMMEKELLEVGNSDYRN